MITGTTMVMGITIIMIVGAELLTPPVALWERGPTESAARESLQ